MIPKKEMRNIIREMRKAMNPGEKKAADAVICRKVMEMASGFPDKNILIYIAKEDEVNLNEAVLSFIRQGRRVAVPRVYGKELKFHRILSLDDLEDGVFGLKEPKKDLPVLKPDGDLVFMPGMAYGKKGERLGYGAGYYDRYLSGYPGNILTGIGYDFQTEREFEASMNDIPVSQVITEKRSIKF